MESYVGVDVGGTTVGVAIARADGTIRAERTIATESHRGPKGVLKRIGATVNDLAASVEVHPAGLGMGVPGLVDLRAGVTRFLPNFPGKWRNVPVRDLLSPQIGCDVYLLNDVRNATLGELTFGHGSSAGTMIFYTIGTGIGGGVVVDGQLRLGPLGAAGELGHQTVIPDGLICGCGNRGCLETVASAPALTAEGVRLLLSGQAQKLGEIVEGDVSRITPKEMALAAENGDDSVREAIIRWASYLGIGVATMVTALHPDLIVIGGGPAAMGPLLFDTVRETVRQRVKMFPVDDVRIEPSNLGNRAGVLGGVALAMKSGLIPQ